MKIHAEGLVGYGEGSSLEAPLYVPEYSRETYQALVDFIAPAIVGKRFENAEALAHAFRHVRGHAFAKTAVECAFWHLLAQKSGRPLRELIGGVHTSVEVGESLGIPESGKVEDLLEEVQLRIDEGFRRIKIKTKPGWDVGPIEAIRERFGSNLSLMIDGNSAYGLELVEIFRELDAFGLLMVEQPLEYDDIVDHATLQRQIRTPICLDESILNVRDARKAIELGACKIINIKTGRVGGLVEAKKIHDLCQTHNIPVWCGGMLETSIGRWFNLALASLPGFTLPADMSPSATFFAEELVENPLCVTNGLAEVPDSLDYFGVSERLIKKATVKKRIIRAAA